MYTITLGIQFELIAERAQQLNDCANSYPLKIQRARYNRVQVYSIELGNYLNGGISHHNVACIIMNTCTVMRYSV